MELADYKGDILLQLGAPIVEVEVDLLIDNIIKKALREIQRYISTKKFMTIGYTEMIDLSDKKVYAVSRVLRESTSPKSGSAPGDIDTFYLQAHNYGRNSGFSFENYLQRMTLQSIKSSISTDLYFIWDPPHLFINASEPKPSLITIEYVPIFEDVSEITDPYWQDWLSRLALALTKEILGRVRGKYVLNSAIYNLDADQLLAEAAAELVDIRTYLQENSEIVYPID